MSGVEVLRSRVQGVMSGLTGPPEHVLERERERERESRCNISLVFAHRPRVPGGPISKQRSERLVGS